MLDFDQFILIAQAVAEQDDSGVSLFSILAFFVFFGLVCLLYLYFLDTMIAYVRNRPSEITQYTPSHTPKAIEEHINQLELEGFRQLTTIKRKITRFENINAWIMVSENQEIWVEVYKQFGQIRVEFYSLFRDNALILTRFPIGSTIQSEQLESRFAKWSWGAALYYHRLTLEKWRIKHDDPLLIQSATDLENLYEVYQREHRKQDLSWAFNYFLLFLILISSVIAGPFLALVSESLPVLSLVICFLIYLIGILLLGQRNIPIDGKRKPMQSEA